MDLSIDDTDFLDAFEHLDTHEIGPNSKNNLEIFALNSNGNEFDDTYLYRCLLEPFISYTVSRKLKKKYKDKPHHLVVEAREKFIEYVKNKGELGELLLFCFLEAHLGAPKILSKLELKTSTSHYVNGSDGVHYRKLDNNNYQLIFGESKKVKGLTKGITEAFKSIHDFKNEVNEKKNKKSGLPYEKSLISNHLEKETFTQEEQLFIESIVYPKKESNYRVDDAFGIFLGYETIITEKDKELENNDFREKIHTQIRSEIQLKFDHIQKKIKEYGLTGHSFYIYIVPLSDIAGTNARILQKLTA